MGLPSVDILVRMSTCCWVLDFVPVSCFFFSFLREPLAKDPLAEN